MQMFGDRGQNGRLSFIIAIIIGACDFGGNRTFQQVETDFLGDFDNVTAGFSMIQ